MKLPVIEVVGLASAVEPSSDQSRLALTEITDFGLKEDALAADIVRALGEAAEDEASAAAAAAEAEADAADGPGAAANKLAPPSPSFFPARSPGSSVS